ncbi:MAG: hypothetical protein AB7V56_06805 [Candidatus Nitrosocosmicus sp.]
MNDIELRDIIIKRCLECNDSCPRTWFNKTLDHKIICRCKCHDLTEVRNYDNNSDKNSVNLVSTQDLME